MIAMDTLDHVEAAQLDRNTESQRRFWVLVELLADGGDEPEADDVADVLAASGKSVADLRSAVQTRQTRRQMREQLASVESAADEATNILDAQERQMRAEFAAAQQRFEEGMAPIAARREQIREAAHRTSGFRSRLIRDCPDPDLQAAYSNVARRLQALEPRRRDAEYGRREAELKAIDEEQTRLLAELAAIEARMFLA